MEVCESREEHRNAMGQMEDDSIVHMEIDHEFIAIQGLLDANKVIFGDAERGASGSDDSEAQPPAAVQGRAAEVGGLCHCTLWVRCSFRGKSLRWIGSQTSTG